MGALISFLSKLCSIYFKPLLEKTKDQTHNSTMSGSEKDRTDLESPQNESLPPEQLNEDDEQTDHMEAANLQVGNGDKRESQLEIDTATDSDTDNGTDTAEYFSKLDPNQSEEDEEADGRETSPTLLGADEAGDETKESHAGDQQEDENDEKDSDDGEDARHIERPSAVSSSTPENESLEKTGDTLSSKPAFHRENSLGGTTACEPQHDARDENNDETDVVEMSMTAGKELEHRMSNQATCVSDEATPATFERVSDEEMPATFNEMTDKKTSAKKLERFPEKKSSAVSERIRDAETSTTSEPVTDNEIPIASELMTVDALPVLNEETPQIPDATHHDVGCEKTGYMCQTIGNSQPDESKHGKEISNLQVGIGDNKEAQLKIGTDCDTDTTEYFSKLDPNQSEEDEEADGHEPSPALSGADGAGDETKESHAGDRQEDEDDEKDGDEDEAAHQSEHTSSVTSSILENESLENIGGKLSSKPAFDGENVLEGQTSSVPQHDARDENNDETDAVKMSMTPGKELEHRMSNQASTLPPVSNVLNVSDRGKNVFHTWRDLGQGTVSAIIDRNEAAEQKYIEMKDEITELKQKVVRVTDVNAQLGDKLHTAGHWACQDTARQIEQLEAVLKFAHSLRTKIDNVLCGMNKTPRPENENAERQEC